MKLAGRFVFAIVAAATFVSAAFASHAHVPTPSTWVLNVQKSDFGGAPALKSDVYVMVTDTEKWMKFTEVTVDAEGKTSKFSWSGVPNGKMYSLVGIPGAHANFKTDDDSGHIVYADGGTIDMLLTYSDDKKTAIERATVKDKAGHVTQQKLVYERKK